MSGMSDEALALLRKDIYADPVGSEQDLLAHVDHLTVDNARLREGIEAISSVSWDVVHPSWVKHMCRDLLNPPTKGETDHE